MTYIIGLIILLLLLAYSIVIFVVYYKREKKLLNYLRSLDYEEFAIIKDSSILFPFSMLEECCKRVEKENIKNGKK